MEYHRRSVRLTGHYYAAGTYYVTICTQSRECLLGEVINGEMQRNAFGDVSSEAWNQIQDHFPSVTCDVFVVMPNHVHGIIIIKDNSGEPRPKRLTLGAVVAYYKYQSAKQINVLRDATAAPVWQRGYHDRIVRDQYMLENARLYIERNPKQWTHDIENPANVLPAAAKPSL